MKLSKKQETDIWNVYNTWLNSYINGDVKTYNLYLDKDYHFIGSTNNEEFLNKKDTSNFFKKTADQLAGKTKIKNEIKIIEKFEDLIFITHLFDAWFLIGDEWTYYGRFRFTSALKENKDGWRFIYQHFSMPDTKAQEGETLGAEKVSKENQELRDAIKRRTIELEAKNRELEIEGALERIRAQAVAMKTSSDLLDIVVTMRNEFIKLGHEAHYFWHMMWLPETYEKAMTSGDGTKIGFVMKLPRHMHGNIPLLAEWEKSKNSTVVYTMNADEAIDYVDKMVDLGDFKSIDPQAPSHDDIKHIGGLTFIMARTSHGEIGYSLPGIVKNPPKEDIDILVKFAGAFDLAHQRFLDLQKAETQAREVQIELALEKVRSRSMAMHKSTDLSAVIENLFYQLKELDLKVISSWVSLVDVEKNSIEIWVSHGELKITPVEVKGAEFENFQQEIEAWKNKQEFILIKMPKDIAKKTLKEFFHINLALPKEDCQFHLHQLWHEHGFLGLGMWKETTKEEYKILQRFTKVFQQTYTRFLDLQKAETQARESEIELALERVRARTMAMQHSDELQEASFLLDEQVRALGIKTWGCAFHIYGEKESTEWFGNEAGVLPTYTVPREGIFKEYYQKGQKGESLVIKEFSGKACIDHYEYMSSLPVIGDVLKNLKKTNRGFPTYQLDHVVYFKYGYLLFITKEHVPESHDIFKRFAKVFQQTYTRFLDLQKAEKQARENQIELALERVRARTMSMQRSDELRDTSLLLFQQVEELGINSFACGFNIWDEDKTSATAWMAGKDRLQKPFKTNSTEDVYALFHEAEKRGDSLFVLEQEGKELEDHYKYMLTIPEIKELNKAGLTFPTFQIIHCAYFSKGYLMFITHEPVPDTHDIFVRFAKVFEQTYTRFLDLQKAEAQAKEAQIETALERIRSRSMAMHKSEELKEVIQVVYDQFVQLNIPIEHAGFILDYKEQDDMHIFLADHNAVFPEISFPYFDSGHWNSFIEAKKKGNHFFTNLLDFDEKNKFYKDLFQFIPDLPEEVKATYFSCDGLAISTVLLDNVGLYIENFSAKPFSDEENSILMRFGKVFQQTYTRFLDLQKAEAQTKEAQIEMALEKVRSRTMAMQKGEEVKDVVVLLYKELIALGVTNFATCGYVEVNEETKRQATWVTSPGGDSLGLFHLPLTGDTYFDARYEAWKKQETIFHQTVAGKVRRKHLEYAITTFNSKEAEEMVLNQFPDPTVFYCFNFSHGYLHLVSGSYLKEEEENLLARFTRVFEQTYARFLDLEKAEAQTRTAQINLAVERVRAKALAMHKSEEIMEVVAKLKDEVMGLNIPDVVASTIFLNENDDKVRMWDLSSLEHEDNYSEVPFDITFKLKKSDPHLYVKRVWENPKDYFVEMQDEKDFKRLMVWLREQNKNEIADEVEDHIEKAQLKRLYHAGKKLNNGKLVIDLLNPPTEEMESILTKMGAAFDLAYKRFEDLKKAEAQTREALIEAALEKVRSRSLAMHKPDELQEVISVVAEKLQELEVIYDSGGVILCTYFPDNKDVMHWIVTPDFSSSQSYYVPYFDNPIFSEAWESKNRGDLFFSKEFPVEVKNHFFEYNFEHSDYKHMPEDYKQHVLKADKHHLTAAWSKNSAILIPSLTDVIPSENDINIMIRFARVFEQAYIRFLDLQKSEAQAREAQIEAALERVRSRSMAMHKSEELLEVISVVSEQLQVLDFRFAHVSFANNDRSLNYKFWVSAKGQSKPMLFKIPYIDIPVMINVRDAQKRSLPFHTDILTIKEHKQWHQHLLKHDGSKIFTKEENEFIMNRSLTRSIAINPNIMLILANYASIPYSEEENKIIERFGKVFEQSYTRFLDLQKAEEQAREAQIEASLERVRSRTLAMQNSEELAQTSVIVFQQLLELGIPPNRLFIGIAKDNGTSLDAWATSEDGSKLGSHFSLQASKSKVIKKMLAGWKQQKKSLIIDLKDKELQDYIHYLSDEMNIPFTHGLEQKRRVQTIAYFSGGLIGMAAPEEQSEASIRLLERFASVFNLTYTRFNDLKIAEAQAKKAEEDLINLQLAKKSAEEALSELQLTQTQLIQSEKMASLGELTAGIAHEIQNPLNFVNNFSEVSKELLDEMMEEIEKGDMDEVKAIMQAVIQNLDKINHHGKRADGIVKGMLQHSRSSTGNKEPTNINVLADEYLRLAYHGLRAKDKSFNATLVTDFDENLGKISIIPQDIGRVVLNLLTNAFYVVNEKKQLHVNGYEPTVSLTTKKNGNWVTISVKDNGNGIPQKVLDKIFQPFFTTKPTGQGTGLGLSMSYDIITKGHGGELNVETKNGEGLPAGQAGTTFNIVLPI